MKSLEIKVPDVGVEGALEVIEVCVSPGDRVESDDSIVVLESDKTTVEVPCPSAGIIKSIDVKLGDKVSKGETILILETVENTQDEISEPKVTDNTSETEGQPSSLGDHHGGAVAADSKSPEVLIDVQVPDLGSSEQVQIIEIEVSEGQTVAKDDTLIVLESDKATMEIPSPFSGTLKSLKVSLGDKVSSGDVIGSILGTESVKPVEADNTTVSQKQKPDKSVGVQNTSVHRREEITRDHSGGQDESVRVHAGPSVRRLARELGADLSRVSGSGPKGRVLKEDLNAYIKLQVAQSQDTGSRHAGSALPSVNLPDFSVFGEIEHRQMDKIQRVTAENMQTSWLTVPHVTQFDEADITEMEAFRAQQKKTAEAKGIKLTPMAFLLKACAYALHQLPQFNVSLDMKNSQLIQKKYIHIGIAVDTPNGLVVPVIRDVDKKSLWELAEECQTLALRARERKLMPAEMQGGCFTISSLGALGGTAFTPIVNTPEVAILGVSKALYKPVYLAESHSFVPRLMLPLSLSYDHRAVNGADSARFASLLASLLGDLRGLLL